MQHPAEEIQSAAANALAASVGDAGSVDNVHAVADDMLKHLHDIYDEKLPVGWNYFLCFGK